MGWTDERVELLKKLWLDGHSASQIAKQLGEVTRNAVIGKVHRLGLSGRATPSQPARPVFKAPRPPRPVVTATPPSAARSRCGRRRRRAQPGAGDLRRGTRHGDRAHPGRPHVQMADRRPGDRRLHLLRPPRRRRGPLLRRARPRRLPAAANQEEIRAFGTGPVAAPLYLRRSASLPFMGRDRTRSVQGGEVRQLNVCVGLHRHLPTLTASPSRPSP